MSTNPTSAGQLLKATVFSVALDAVKLLLDDEVDPELLADQLEACASDADLAHATMFLLLMAARGVSVDQLDAVALANPGPSVGSLILPPSYRTGR